MIKCLTKFVLGFMLLAALTIPMWGSPVSIEKARQAAEAWLNLKSGVPKGWSEQDQPRISKFKPVLYKNEVVGYYARVSPYGSIIVTADDSLLPIKLYSTVATFTFESCFEQCILFELHSLTTFVRENRVVNENHTAWDTLIQGNREGKSDRAPYGPLLENFAWSQGTPYNNDCPTDPEHGGTCVTGCVATACAQIMRYWRYPATGMGSHSYTSSPHSFNLSANFATDYDWDSMPIASPPNPCPALSKLMFHVGVALDMQYCSDGSGAYTGQVASILPTYFKYKDTAYYTSRSGTDAEWFNKIRAEINASRPIEYSFRNASNQGHAVVCDGYDERTGPEYWVHINFGWGGSSTGWYNMNDIAGWNYSHAGVFSIEPNNSSPSFEISDASVTEGNSGTTTISFLVKRYGLNDRTATVQYHTSNGTATAGTEYQAKSGILSFDPGVTTQNIDILVYGDKIDEANETFSVTLSNATNATIADGQAKGTINDDDAAPSIVINDVAIAEGNSGGTNASFSVTLSEASSFTVTVKYATTDNTAIAGTDYTAKSGTLTFSPGTTTQNITAVILGDTTVESNKSFYVDLSTPTNATISDSRGVCTIQDDDTSLTINDITVNEGNPSRTDGRVVANFTVTRAGITTQTTTVHYQTANGTAIAGTDYQTASGTLTFAPSVTTQTVSVFVYQDTVCEPNEILYVNLSNVTNAALIKTKGQCTINDDDGTPAITISDITLAEGTGASDTYAKPVITLSKASSQTVTVKYQTADNTATAGSDYRAKSGTVTFSPGVLSQTISVAVIGDSVAESTETFYVNLATPTNATIGDAQGVCSISNDDTNLTIADISVNEGNSGTTNATFTVTRSGVTTQTTTVQYQTANGTAIAGSDYVAKSGTLTFAPSATTQTIVVSIYGETIYEPNETFYVNLSNATNATITDAKATCTATNDDAVPTLSIGNTTVTEGTESKVYAKFNVTLSNASYQTVTVKYQTENNTAMSGSDYTATSGSLSFAPGTLIQTVSVAVIGDSVVESTETFYVNLSAATNATINVAQGTGTILDNDTNLTIADISANEGNSGTTNATFTVTRSGVTTQTTTVQYQTANGTAVAGSDYVTKSGTLTFAPGATTQTIAVPVYGEAIYEPDEKFYVNLSNAVNATITDSQAMNTILNDDTTPTLSINNTTVTEGTGTDVSARFTVTLSGATSLTATVKYQTADNTATVSDDYTAKSGTLTFAPGVTTQIIPITVVGDLLVESTETFYVNLSAATNATIATAQGTGTILDNDTDFVIADSSITEGNPARDDTPSRALMSFTVTRSGITTQTSTVQYQTTDATALAGVDYQAKSGILTFGPGTLTQTFTVVVNGDSIWEPDEYFYVNLSNPANAHIKTGKAKGTITNDDSSPTISINDITITEGTGANVNATFTLSLSGLTCQTVTVKYATADGTATTGKDYTSKSGTLSFASGTTTNTITIAVLGDNAVETDETFVVNLTNPVNATIADAQGTCTIKDNDTALSINDVSVTEGNSGTVTATFTVTRTGITTQTTTVQYQTANGTATAGSDYQAKSGTLTFGAGVTTQNVAIVVNGDTLYETDETFFVNLSHATNAVITKSQGIGTATNDDTQPSLAIGDSTVIKPASGTVNANFVVTLSATSVETVTVKYQTANDTAVSPTDYTAKSGTLTFSPGTTTVSVVVVVKGGSTTGLPKSFYVNLSDVQHATISDGQGTGTITKVRQDYDGDRRSDLALWSETSSAWYILKSSDNNQPQLHKNWKLTGAWVPACGDYDGDGKADIAMWNKTTGEWYCLNSDSDNSVLYKHWGNADCIPVPGDYDGDGKTDFAVWNKATGEWYALKSSESNNSCLYETWGNTECIPVPGDYDGDGKTDFAVWNKATGEWYALKSSDGNASYLYKTWGNSECIPVPGDYDGDGKTDFAVWNKATGEWYALKSSDGNASYLYKTWGKFGDDEFIPVPADYDGDGKTDFSVWNETAGTWYSLKSSTSNEAYLYRLWTIQGQDERLPITEWQHVTCDLKALSIHSCRKASGCETDDQNDKELPGILGSSEIPHTQPGVPGNNEIPHTQPGVLGYQQAPQQLPGILGYEDSSNVTQQDK